MKITNVDVIVTCPGRNFVILRIETDEGVVGLGDGTLNGREQAVAHYLSEHVAPMLIGRDPGRIEDIWQSVHRSAYWYGGPVSMSALASVDIALWDIKGKVANLPIYDLLGGRSRDRLELYGHASGSDINETVEAVAALKDQGYRVIRAQTAVPGMKTAYGISPSGGATLGYVPATADLPIEHKWDAEAYLNVVPELFDSLTLQFGDSVRFIHDTHHRLRPIEAARLARELEPYHLFWLEDVCRPQSADSFRKVRQASHTPLALGEVFHTLQDCRPYLEEKLIDYIRIAAIHSGGISNARRIIDFAAAHDVRTGLHGPPDISPIGMAAHVHLGAWAPNFGIQEWAVMPAPEMREVFLHQHTIERGQVLPSEQPGLGVEFNVTAANKYPYRRSYMGINRLPDGTVWHY